MRTLQLTIRSGLEGVLRSFLAYRTERDEDAGSVVRTLRECPNVLSVNVLPRDGENWLDYCRYLESLEL